MSAGDTLFSDIQARVADIREATMAVARMANVLQPTVLHKGATGMATRKVDIYSDVTFAQRGEGDDTAAQKFEKTAKSELTPAIYSAQVILTDARLASDYDSELANAQLTLGGAAAKHVDVNLATLFSSAEGGTIGSGISSTISWTAILNAQALLINQDLPAGLPIFCALHPFQWKVLLAAGAIASSSIQVSRAFQDRLTFAPNFFQVPDFVGITFVITNHIAISGTAAYGCVYVPPAFALDTRLPLDIEPERDASKQANELNAHMWYAYGTWRPEWAVALYCNAATPSGV